MDSLQNKILHTMGDQNWCFSELHPLVKAKLKDRLGIASGSERTLTALCSKFYLNLDMGPITGGSDKIAKQEIWETICRKHIESAQFLENDISFYKKITEAIHIIEKFAPPVAKEYHQWIDFICPVTTVKFRAVSNPHFLGTIFLGPQQKAEDLAISIVHEMAHQELFLVNFIDRLVMADSDYHLIHAPLQGRERPPIGRLHSAHALFRMVLLADAIGHKSLKKYEELLRQTIQTFQVKELTEFCWRMVHEVYV